MPTTTDRRSAVRELIEQGQFQSQSELHQALVKRGFQASQPALRLIVIGGDGPGESFAAAALSG